MQKDTLNKLGLAAAILLLPGGFVLGATLAARHYRRKAAKGSPDPGEKAPAPPDDAP